MQNLTSEKIEELNSESVHLSSSLSKGKLLTLNSKNKITLEKKKPGSSNNTECQMWKLIPSGDGGFFISSPKGKVICHYMKNEGDISVKDLSIDTIKRYQQKNLEDGNEVCNGCVWKLGKNSEIYQDNPKGGERYLWLVNGELFVTLDGFLADNWVIVSDVEKYSRNIYDGKPILKDPPKDLLPDSIPQKTSKWNVIYIAFAGIILLMIFCLIFSLIL